MNTNEILSNLTPSSIEGMTEKEMRETLLSISKSETETKNQITDADIDTFFEKQALRGKFPTFKK